MLIDNCQVDSCLDHILELLEILQQFLGKLKTIKGAISKNTVVEEHEYGVFH